MLITKGIAPPITTPLVITLHVVGLMRIGGVVPLVVIPAVVGLLAAVIVALTSRSDHPPRYHFVSCV